MATLLHISDFHLYADPAHALKEERTQDSCVAVLDSARRKFPCPDGIILGGDLAQDEAEAAYHRLGRMLREWRSPFLITPGNHENLARLSDTLIPALNSFSSYVDCLQLDWWQVISLNSHASDMISGFIDEAELMRLERLLAQSRSRHVLIALHHPPMPVGSEWMDRIGLKNSRDFWDVIDRHQHVRAILSGHIHQAFDATAGRVRLLGTPSTCIQFKPNHDAFALDGLSPGYRWLKLMPDGNIETGVERVTGFIPPDLSDVSHY
jgi:Icc protein